MPSATLEAPPLEIGTEDDFPLYHSLVIQLADADPKIRGGACWTLGQLRYWPCLRLLGRVLRTDSDCLVRMQAAQALARMKTPGAAQALIRGLKDDDDLVQYACVIGLGTLRDPQGIYPLEQLRKRLGDDHDLSPRIDWAADLLKALEEPGLRPDRRRGGVSKKIRSYLDKVDEKPRDGIAHNNLAVAYFHATEFDLAQRHCLIAKAFGARVEWLWKQLVEAEFDPASFKLSREDKAFIASSDDLLLTDEPKRTDLSRRDALEQARAEGIAEDAGLGAPLPTDASPPPAPKAEPVAHRPPPAAPKPAAEAPKPAAEAPKPPMGVYRIADHREVAKAPPSEVKPKSKSKSRGKRRKKR